MWDENKVRIIDIAEELGVSTATVSNVLHGKTKKISDATVKRVEQKLEERGYIPNMAATLLGRNNSRIIGVIVNNHEKYEGRTFEDPFISAAINYLSDEIEANHYDMMLKKAKNIMDIVTFSTMWNLDGMIIIGFCEDDYQNLRDHIRIPFVVYDGYMHEQSRISNVTIDDYDGGKQVGAYFKASGHQKVLCIADNCICMDLARYQGFTDGFGSETDFLQIPMEQEARKRFYETHLEQIKEYTAVFAVSDYYAIDFMNAMLQHKIRIPEDISVVGFDGSTACLNCNPHLSSVNQNNQLRAHQAMELLQKMIANPQFYDSICVPVQLEIRETSIRRKV